jgi:hypothetical protein
MRLRGSECRCINQQGTESPARTFFRRARRPAKAAVSVEMPRLDLRKSEAGSSIPKPGAQRRLVLSHASTSPDRGPFFVSSLSRSSGFQERTLLPPTAHYCDCQAMAGRPRCSARRWNSRACGINIYAISVKCKYVCVLPRVIGCDAAGCLQHRPATG